MREFLDDAVEYITAEQETDRLSLFRIEDKRETFMAAQHWYHFSGIKPQICREGGTRTDLRCDKFPPLKNFSLSLLTLEPKAVREPHWHSNANELSYCLEGNGLMTLFTPGANHETFTIEAGDVVFVPKNFLHHIENSGSSPMKLLIAFNHENANSNEISSAFQKIPAEAMAAVFQQTPSFFSPLRKGQEPVVISQQSNPIQLPYHRMPNRFKFDLSGSIAPVQTPGGSVKFATRGGLPMLDGLAAYQLHLKQSGIREPHWHPNCDELNYLVSGKVRLSLVFPDGGAIEQFELAPGDISYLPQGYLHHIQNIGDEEVNMIVFFNHEYPADMGISGAAGAYSNEILASLFGVPSNYFESFPKHQHNLLVVAGGG